jgi:DNA polymerase-3 subunit gamma/tau
MDNFIVSARKYRPQNFETVIGQQHITTTLKNAIRSNHLAHSFLFCGPRGVGKTTCARILAKTINCTRITPESEACNTCENCVAFDSGNTFNIHELDAASNNSVDDIRILCEQVRFAPQAGKYKVYIIDEVHMLSANAFNAFLKTLEEPPSYAIFILATTEKHKILPTILSRCQIFDFKRITIADTTSHLRQICEKEGIKAEQAALHVIAQKSEGCLRDALSILDKIVSFTNSDLTYKNTLEHLNILDEDYFFELLDLIKKQQLTAALLMYDSINSKGFEGDTVINGFAEFMRNVLLSRDAGAAALIEVADDFKPRYVETAKNTDPAYLISALNLLGESELHYRQSRNKRLHVEMLLIKLCYLEQALQLSAEPGALEKKKLTAHKRIVGFRALPTLPGTGAARTTTTQPEQAAKKEPVPTVVPQNAARLEIETPPPAPPKKDKEKTAAPPISSLNRLKEQIAREHRLLNPVKELDEETLAEAWSLFISRLRETNNPIAVAQFTQARIRVIDPNTIGIKTRGQLEKTIIEAEKSTLVPHLQEHFNNRMLTYQIEVEERGSDAEPPAQILSKKQQYQLLIEKYPLVKELRDKLKLDLG